MKSIKTYQDFSLGAMPEISHERLPETAMAEIKGMRVDPTGALRTRKGHYTLPGSVSSQGRLLGLYAWTPEGYDEDVIITQFDNGSGNLAFFNSGAYNSFPDSGLESSPVVTTKGLNISPSQVGGVGLFVYRQDMYVGDCVKLRRFNWKDKAWYRVQPLAIPTPTVSLQTTPTAPASNPTARTPVSFKGVVSPNSTIRFFTTYVAANGMESPASVESSISNYSNQWCNMEFLPIELPSGMTAIKLYRTENDGGVFFFDGYIHSGAYGSFAYTTYGYRFENTDQQFMDYSQIYSPPTTGALSAGTYEYLVAQEDTYGIESTISSPASITVSSGYTGKVTISGTCPENTYKVNVYRNTGSAWRLVGSAFPSGTTWAITDTAQDLSAKSTPQAFQGYKLTDVNRCNMFVVSPTKTMRAYAAGDASTPNRMYYSDAGAPSLWKGSFLVPTTSDGPITAMALFGDAVLVFYNNGAIWAMRGNDVATDAQWFRLPVSDGTKAPKSIVATPASLTWLGASGVYSLSLAALDYNLVMQGTDDIIKNLTGPKLAEKLKKVKHPETACATWDAATQSYVLAFKDGDKADYDFNDTLLTINWATMAVTVDDGPKVTGMTVLSDSSVVMSIDSATKYIAKLEGGGTEAVSFSFTSPPYIVDSPDTDKMVFSVMLRTEGVPQSLMATVTTDDGDVITINPPPLDAGQVTQWEVPVRRKARTFTVHLEGTTVEEFKVHSISFLYKPGKPKPKRR